MKINKKLSTAIVLSLMMGVYGSASAAENEILYGSSTDGHIPAVDYDNSCYVTKSSASLDFITDNVASDNKYTVKASTDWDSTWKAVYGGFSINVNAENNHVKVKGGEIRDWVMGGFSMGSSTDPVSVSSNIVEISGTTVVHDDVSGGSVQDGNAINNVAIVTGGTIYVDVHGGEVTNQGDATGNKATISGASTNINGNVYGGYTKNGTAGGEDATDGNTVSINGASATAKVQIGTIEGGKYKNDTGNVYGGKSADGAANNNKVGTSATNAATNFTANKIYGGQGTTSATGNKVWLGAGAEVNEVYGGDGTNGATGNEVWLGKGAEASNVLGGNSSDGNSTNNTVTIGNGGWAYVVTGGQARDGNANNNEVIIYGTVAGVEGGSATRTKTTANPTEANNNIVTIEGTVNGDVYGGVGSRPANGSADNNISVIGNSVTISGIVQGKVAGGRAQYGTANGNTVTITGGKVQGAAIYGGYAYNGNAGGYDEENKKSLGNKVTISGGTIGKAATSTEDAQTVDIYGGFGKTGASYNEVEMTATSSPIVYGNVIGGMADGNAENNVVTLNGGSILANGSAIGGKSENGNATKNQVTVGATSVQTVNGGRADNGTASENVVTVEQWNHSGGNIRGGFGKIATQNEVYVKNGIVDADVYGGLGESEATKNYVKVEGAVDSQNLVVYGGESFSGTVSQNVVDVYGKPNSVYGGYTTGSGAVSENVVNLYKDSEVNTVYGGRSDSGAVSGNIINVMGDVTVIYDIVGGESTSGAANNNIVNLGGYKDETGILYRELGAANVTRKLIGGIGTSRSGNTLNVYSLNNQVGGIEGFQKMNFFIPKDAAVGAILVKSTGDVDLSEAKDNIKAGFHNETSLTYGDKVKLIASDTKVSGMDGTSTLKVEETDFTDVDLLVYQGDDSMNQVSANATTLVAEIYNQELNENSKVLLETVMEEASLINDGSDMLAGAGLDSAQSAIAADLQNGAASGSMSIFGAVSGNKSKLKTGSHVDANGWNMNIGLAKELKNKDGKMILAPVVEYGRGEYDSYLDNGYHADGNAHFVGGGVMAKQINNNGNYFEGSVRAGKVSSEFKSTGGNYDSDAKYVAGHIGVGHIQKMDAKNSMDYYAKFFHTHISDDDVVVHAKGKDLALDLDSMNSSRLRLGGRLNHAMGKNNAYYFGLAYQREFNGSVTGALEGKDIVAPSTKGDTGFMELGVKLFDASKYDLDFGGFGSVGKKKGAGFNLNFNWKF